MKKIIRSFSKNLKESFGPGVYQVNGIDVQCVHCKHNRFERGRAQLNTAAATFFNLDFANRSAEILICDQCGYVHWFYKDVKRV
ncbi:hypothetical protein BEP19_02140 [Ammoniphilus oxalaticus]|uniref:DNA-binding protein n=1 Tax=Ammoniphilus oxalaticus TaxID=66863 RepID=A0A419SP75_9BACL|nr:hypothetical protein [Ammoniphilus oxalaticus]RKD26042.1 hypothetical protein BEP19_02140 [Ammoniphilus oxalaticus]